MTNPVLIEVLRGDRVESRHAGAVAVLDPEGGVVFAAGDIDAAVYPRSAVKGMQALPLIESGAADRFGLGEAEIALACASHSGEPAHVETATAMLAKAGQSPACLECGVQWPSDARATRALAASGQEPGAIHNNCSGKHSGFVCVSCAMGQDPAGYVRPDHPAMREVTAALSAMTGTPLDGGEPRRRMAARSRPTRSRCGLWRWGSRASAAARISRPSGRRRRRGSGARWPPTRSWWPAPAGSTPR